MVALPAFVRIAEARLWISPGPSDPLSEVTRRRIAGPPLTEAWRCDIALAPFGVVDLPQWDAFLEGLDGRLGIVDLSMTSALSPQPLATVSLGAAATYGASAVSLTVAGAALPAGSVLSVGAVDGTEQIVECLTAAPIGTTLIEIAPRLRLARPSGTIARVGSAAIGLFRLATDETGRATVQAGRAIAALELVEHIP